MKLTTTWIRRRLVEGTDQVQVTLGLIFALACILMPLGATGQPIAVASYTYEESGDYPPGGLVNEDTSGSELTDGIFVTQVAFYDPAYVGFRDDGSDNGQGQPKILFDLGESYNLSSVSIRYLHSTTQAGGTITAPESVFISTSEDGSNFSTPVQFTGFDATSGNEVRTRNINLTGMSGRWVRLDLKQTGQWSFHDEISFYSLANIFEHIPGGASDIGVGSDGSVYAIGYPNKVEGDNYAVFKWNPNGQGPDPNAHWSYVSGISGVRVDVDAAGNPWVIKAEGSLHRFSNGSWVTVPGGASDIGVGADGSVYAIGYPNKVEGDNYAVFKWNPNGQGSDPNAHWSYVSGISGVRVDVDAAGNPWVTKAEGSIHRFSNGSWVTVPGGASDIGVGADGSVYAIGYPNKIEGDNYGVFQWNPAGQGSDPNAHWSIVGGISGTNISVDPQGKPWVLKADGSIYRDISGQGLPVQSVYAFKQTTGCCGPSYRMESDGSNSEALTAIGVDFHDFTYDPVTGLVYAYQGYGGHAVVRMELDGSNMVQVTQSAGNANGWGLDPVNRKVYMGDRDNDKIWVADADATNGALSVFLSITDPADLEPVPSQGYIYFTSAAGVRRINDDGTGLVTLVADSGSSGKYNGLALDLTNGKMYWSSANGSDYVVRRANLDGSNVETLYGTSTPEYQSGIAVDPVEGKLYVANDALGLRKFNLDGSGAETIFAESGIRGVGLLLEQGGSAAASQSPRFKSAAVATVPGNDPADAYDTAVTETVVAEFPPAGTALASPADLEVSGPSLVVLDAGADLELTGAGGHRPIVLEASSTHRILAMTGPGLLTAGGEGVRADVTPVRLRELDLGRIRALELYGVPEDGSSEIDPNEWPILTLLLDPIPKAQPPQDEAGCWSDDWSLASAAVSELGPGWYFVVRDGEVSYEVVVERRF